MDIIGVPSLVESGELLAELWRRGGSLNIAIVNDDFNADCVDEIAKIIPGACRKLRIISLPPGVHGMREFFANGGTRTDLIKIWGQPEASAAGIVVKRLSEVAPQQVQWLWPGLIPLGKLTLISGDPGLGKSFLTLDIAARVSAGMPFPGDAPACPGHVVIVSAEDDIADTIRPRLDAAGADCRKIVAIEGVRDHEAERERTLSLAHDLHEIRRAVTECRDCRLLIVDPISAYLGGVDTHRNSDLRAVLAPLGNLAAETGIAIVCVTHNRKTEGRAVYAALGSVAFTAAVRSAYTVMKDPDDELRRLFLPVKANLARGLPGLSYEIVPGVGDDSPRVVWDSEPVYKSADDIIQGQGRTRKTKTEELLQWVRNQGKPVTAREAARSLRRYRYSGEAAHDFEQLAAEGFGTWEFTNGCGRPTKVFTPFRNITSTTPTPRGADETPAPEGAKGGFVIASRCCASDEFSEPPDLCPLDEAADDDEVLLRTGYFDQPDQPDAGDEFLPPGIMRTLEQAGLDDVI